MRSKLDHSTESGSLPSQIEDDKKRRLDDWQREQSKTKINILPNQENPEHSSGSDLANSNEQFTHPFGDENENKSEESDDESEHEGGTTTVPAFDSVRTFILRSEAFSRFQLKLRNFICPSFASELENLVQTFSSQGPVQEGTSTSSAEATECYRRLENLAADLASADLHRISIRLTDFCTWWNLLKLSVEAKTGRRWDWWPLSDPIVPLEHGNAYVFWTCTCGEQRYEVVPIAFAQKTENLLHKYKSTTKAPERRASQSGDPQRNRGQGSSTPDIQGSIPLQPKQLPLNIQPNRSPNNAPTSANQGRSPAINMPLVREQVVFLGVNNGSDCNVAQVPVSLMDDDAFYDALREKYNGLRGVLRRYLSYEIYHHCDFAQFEKIGANEFVPGHLRPSFPKRTDDDYDFKPKPPKPVPPIQPHEFTRRFYTCRRGGELHKHFLTFIPCQKKCSRYPGPHDALDRIPKRNRALNVSRQDREFLWGLLAIHHVSMFRVGLYHLLILMGPFVFWWLWLFRWHHSGDLQNASVPFSIVCVLLSMFWFPLLHK